jgi:LEA14-like dessication related protein
MKKTLFTLTTGLLLLSSCKSGSIKDPEYRDIRNVRLITAGLLQSTAGIDLIYFNPNKFSVQLKEMRGDVYINNFFFGKFEVEEKVFMSKMSEFMIPAIIKLNILDIIKNQRDLWKKKDPLIKIEGMAKVLKAGVAFNVPINYEGNQNIEQLIAFLSK